MNENNMHINKIYIHLILPQDRLESFSFSLRNFVVNPYVVLS